jgi:hypothetical protein
MRNILANSKDAMKALAEGKKLDEFDRAMIVELYKEVLYQTAAIRQELYGIDPEELTRAEKNILRIIES